MRGICFKEQLFDLIVNGRKTVTRRMADRYKVGEILYLKEPYFVNEKRQERESADWEETKIHLNDTFGLY